MPESVAASGLDWTDLLLAPAALVTERIVEIADGIWQCRCENRHDTDGFTPCSEAGEIVPPVLGPRWDGRTYLCLGCWRMIDADTLEVVGRASQDAINRNLDCSWETV